MVNVVGACRKEPFSHFGLRFSALIGLGFHPQAETTRPPLLLNLTSLKSPMELSNEDRYCLISGMLKAANALATYQIAKDRASAMNTLSARLLNIQLKEEDIELVCEKFKDTYLNALGEFYSSIGITSKESPFWDWLKEYDKQVTLEGKDSPSSENREQSAPKAAAPEKETPEA